MLLVASILDTGCAVDVTWISPSAGDTFEAGDTIVGQWKAEKAVVSPSFRLCIGDDVSGGKSDAGKRDWEDKEGDGDSSCGQAVWPTIQQVEDGSYMIHM